MKAANASMLRALVTSSLRYSIASPASFNSLHAARPFAASRLVSTTRWPSRASCRQISRPRPRLAPVTIATRVFTRESGAERSDLADHLFGFHPFVELFLGQVSQR